MATDFPAIPLDQKTDKNVKLFLDSLAGRMGYGGRAVTFQDLIESGIVALKPGLKPGDIPPGIDPNDIIDVPSGELPDSPTKPFGLATAGSWGAIFLTWDYQSYNDEYGTEIWRSLVNDRDTASLIAVGDGRAYTDNVGEKQTYFYWVRNRSISQVSGGYNQLVGVQGNSNLITTAEDFVMANPDAQFQPFTIANYGTEQVPDWKILLNGQVIVTSDLSIGQLLTGEMRPNTTFTIGNASIEIGTDGLGLGYINVAGDGGIAGNDYMRLVAGNISSFIYDPDIGSHVAYKELRRIERGVTQHAVETIIPAYFKSEPTVYLSFEDISVYNPAYADQAQSLLMSVGPVIPHATINGAWVFTPTAALALSDGVATEIESINTYTSLNTYQANSAHTFNNCEGITVNFTLGSAKATPSGDFQNRIITVYLDGSLNGGVFNQIGTGSVNLTGDGIDKPLIIEVPTLTPGTWTFRYRFVAADRAGTTPGGAAAYEYDEFNITTGDNFTIVNNPSANSVSQLIQANVPSVTTGWNLYAIDYKVDYNRIAEGWYVEYDRDIVNEPLYSQGEGKATVPGEIPQTINAIGSSVGAQERNGVCDSYPPISDNSYRSVSDSGIAGTAGKISISDNQEPYASGRFTNVACNVLGESVVNQDLVNQGCLFGTGKGTISVSNYNVTYYYRKAIIYSTTPNNHYKVDSLTANLGATNISINAATINWLAVGE